MDSGSCVLSLDVTGRVCYNCDGESPEEVFLGFAYSSAI